jgi:hypothetical protein
MNKTVFFISVIVAGIAVLGAASHFRTVNQLEARIHQLEEKVLAAHSQSESALAASKAARRSNSVSSGATAYDDSRLSVRVGEVEESITELKQATDYLMERGQIPLAERKIEELLAKLNDGSLPDSERLNALRLLRRNRSLDDAGMQTTLSWLQASTVDGTRREILRALEGATNAIMSQPMMTLAASDPSNGIREQAVENLQALVNNPQVEQFLWAQLQTETDPRTRQEILEALTRGGASPERIASLQMRAQNPAAALDERLLALQALRRSETDVQQIVASFAATAQSTQDAGIRARIFDAFDGMSDPSLKVPLVYGLQDADARVRERAADALSGYATDPAVQQWLRYVADNDADPRVRREALQALEQQRQQGPRR